MRGARCGAGQPAAGERGGEGHPHPDARRVGARLLPQVQRLPPAVHQDLVSRPASMHVGKPCSDKVQHKLSRLSPLYIGLCMRRMLGILIDHRLLPHSSLPQSMSAWVHLAYTSYADITHGVQLLATASPRLQKRVHTRRLAPETKPARPPGGAS